ncbi:MAG TPA: DUF4304 domain-containing protein [Chitinophagaceae bacterium]|nr:DUF4304 domain-containing protein [Chitinophagaceae bacterium]
MNLTSYKKALLEGLHEFLRPQGFRRKQNIFTLSRGDMTYYICLQSSIHSTDDTLIATVNIETASASQYRQEELSIPEPLYRSSVKNIGEYEGQAKPHWWTIRDESSLQAARQMITEMLRRHVLNGFTLSGGQGAQRAMAW